jgi:large subunit ribosomal protein L30
MPNARRPTGWRIEHRDGALRIERMNMAKKTTGQAASRRVKITLVRSPIGFNKTQAKTVEGMGLRRLHHTVELPDTPATRGMIHKVRHLVSVD